MFLRVISSRWSIWSIEKLCKASNSVKTCQANIHFTRCGVKHFPLGTLDVVCSTDRLQCWVHEDIKKEEARWFHFWASGSSQAGEEPGNKIIITELYQEISQGSFFFHFGNLYCIECAAMPMTTISNGYSTYFPVLFGIKIYDDNSFVMWTWYIHMYIVVWSCNTWYMSFCLTCSIY